MDYEQAVNLSERALHGLGEHFDSVVILGTWMDEGKTQAVMLSCGNSFAVRGLIDRMKLELAQQDMDPESSFDLNDE